MFFFFGRGVVCFLATKKRQAALIGREDQETAMRKPGGQGGQQDDQRFLRPSCRGPVEDLDFWFIFVFRCFFAFFPDIIVALGPE